MKNQIRPRNAVFQYAKAISDERAKNVFQITIDSIPSETAGFFIPGHLADGFRLCSTTRGDTPTSFAPG
ncbi:MAG TPA: hypothetical protein VLQ91_12075 [Draconibacterium sp.]|nr:hypothetical protein [Draconibacterium sp.]